MLPTVKANTQSSDANRKLLLDLIEMQLEQNKVSAQLMREIANSVSALASELEQQQQATESRLIEMASQLEEEASQAFRKRAGVALTAAANRLRNMTSKLRGNQ